MDEDLKQDRRISYNPEKRVTLVMVEVTMENVMVKVTMEKRESGKDSLDTGGRRQAQRILCFLPGTKPSTDLAHPCPCK